MPALLSPNQQRLLGLFYTNPERSFYMQEVGRILRKQPGVFQRTLNALVDAGWLISEYRGHARFFRANTHHSLYPELKRIVAKTSGAEGVLRTLVARLPAVKLALVYGSFAKGKEREGSDIDLLVVGNPHAEGRLLRAIGRLEKSLQREINYKLYSEREYRARRAKRDAFLQEILSDTVLVLKGTPNAV